MLQASIRWLARQAANRVPRATSATTLHRHLCFAHPENTVHQEVEFEHKNFKKLNCMTRLIIVVDMSCRDCTAGNQCPQGAGALDPCPSGYYATANSAACLVCPAGYECPTQENRVQCTAGTYSLQGETTCTTCPDGFLCLDSTTEPTACPAGRYNLNPSASECTACPAGSACPNTDAGPTACGPGFIRRKLCLYSCCCAIYSSTICFLLRLVQCG